MEKDTPVRIEKVGNGFIVRAFHGIDHAVTSVDDTLVFGDLESLNGWLRFHFEPLRDQIKKGSFFPSGMCMTCGYEKGHAAFCPSYIPVTDS